MHVRLKYARFLQPFALTTVLLLWASITCAQTATPPQAPGSASRLAEALDSLARQAETLHSAIPAIECTEKGVSYEQHGNKQKHRSTFTATIRAQRDATGTLQESFRTTELNGKPYNKDTVALTLYVLGPFSDALRVFASDRHACYEYDFLDANRIAYKEKPGERAGCMKYIGRTGVVTLDAQGNATRLEEHASADLQQKDHYLSFALIELRPVDLNGKTYRLLSEYHATMPYGDYAKLFEASYQSCHRFASTVTLLPGTSIVSDDSAPK